MDTRSSLDLVRTRLNRLGLQRATCTVAGCGLLALAASAAAASRLAPVPFRVVSAGLLAGWLAIAARAALALREKRADDLAAARWIEGKVDLEQRLLTLAATPEPGRRSSLWSMLEEDNRAALPRWSGQPLGIPRVPPQAALPVVGLLAALLTLVPLAREQQPPPELVGRESNDGGAGADATGDDQPSAVGAGLTRALSPAPGDGKGRTVEGSTGGRGTDVRGMLASRFERSVAGRALGPPPPAGAHPPDGSEEAGAAGTDARAGGIGKSKDQPGGRPPEQGLARLESGSGGQQTVVGKSGAPGAATRPPGGDPDGSGKPGEEGRPRDGGGKGRPDASGRGKPDAPVADGDATGAGSPGGGGSAAGQGKGGALLAARSLTENAHQRARFALTIGTGRRDAKPGSDSGEQDDPRASIADVARGEQAAERRVRHEEIPAEYERVVKRIFAREP